MISTLIRALAPRGVLPRRLCRRAVPASALLTVAVQLGCASSAATHASPPDPAPSASAMSVRDIDGKTLESLFAGRFAGVHVTRAAGGGLQIRIRGGNNSFYGSNEPLFVVDETPLPGGTGGIVFLSPHDIETIEVLKNPADIAIYGIRGANGVIKITTTRPGRRR
jgi:TonB-dependent SusC/RagA subfamily outer membrane receptor